MAAELNARSRRIRCAIALGLLFSSAAGSALAQDAKWGPHIDLEAKPGTKRSLGEGDAFIPLAQDGTTLLFANLRHRFDDSDGNEGNYGLGVRHMLESGWNLGAYGYFDRRRTEYDNHFNQVTFGVEVLSMDWDARANYYAPVGRRTHLVDALSTAEVSGTTVVFRGGEERSMGGFDAELGWRVPIFDADAGRALRVYGGGYHFSESGVEDITGPRLRAEMVFDSLPNSWEGSRFSLGAEWQHDDPRGGQGFLTARLRIPLQVYGRPASQLTPMERRMADPIVRDIDVVSQAGRFSAPETATATADGKTFTVINGAGFSGSSLTANLTTAGVNSTVILSGAFNTTAQTQMQGGQTLMAGPIAVRSASGRTATLVTSATISGTNIGTSSVLQPTDNTTVQGLTIRVNNTGTAAVGIQANNTSSNIRILNNTVVVSSGASTANAIALNQNTNVTVSGNTATATAVAGQMAQALVVVGGSSATVTGNTFSASGGTTNRAASVTSSTINAGSTGNVIEAGVCNNGGGNTGSLGFTNGTTCP
jgi:hypothetical protein